MALFEPEDARQAALRLIEASPATETEVRIDGCLDAFVRFADSGPTQTADRENLGVQIRVRLGEPGTFREGTASTGSLQAEDLARALDQACTFAEHSPVNAELVAFGGPVKVQETRLEPSTLGHAFEAKADWVKRATTACAEHQLAPSGLARTTSFRSLLLNSKGRDVLGHKSRASFALTASGPSGSGWADCTRADVAEMQVDETIARAVDTARRAQNPANVQAGPTTVVLAPAAVSSLLLFASYKGFGAREVAEESSFLCGRIGTQCLGENVSIRDDANHPMCPDFPFDQEGNPKQPVELVKAGTLSDPVTDPFWSERMNLPLTGHCSDEPNTPQATNLILAPGQSSLDELIAGVEDGLFVTQFHYTNMIEPRDLTLTGMTRNGTFRIENGKLTTPVKNLRFTQSFVEAFSNVSGIGNELTPAGALFDGEVLVPPVRIENFQFTSTTDF